MAQLLVGSIGGSGPGRIGGPKVGTHRAGGGGVPGDSWASLRLRCGASKGAAAPFDRAAGGLAWTRRVYQRPSSPSKRPDPFGADFLHPYPPPRDGRRTRPNFARSRHSAPAAPPRPHGPAATDILPFSRNGSRPGPDIPGMGRRSPCFLGRHRRGQKRHPQESWRLIHGERERTGTPFESHKITTQHASEVRVYVEPGRSLAIVVRLRHMLLKGDKTRRVPLLGESIHGISLATSAHRGWYLRRNWYNEGRRSRASGG